MVRASRVDGAGSETVRLGGGRYGVITAYSAISRLRKFLAFFFWAFSLHELNFLNSGVIISTLSDSKHLS